AGQQQTLVDRGHVAAADHHASEDEHEKQRLQECLQSQLNCVTPRDMSVASQHGAKSLPVQSRKLLPVWCRNRFSRLGSEIWTSESSAPELAATLAISGIKEPPRSA